MTADAGYFVARCRACEIDMPFNNPADEVTWALEHSRGRERVHGEFDLWRSAHLHGERTEQTTMTVKAKPGVA